MPTLHGDKLALGHSQCPTFCCVSLDTVVCSQLGQSLLECSVP